jgi:alpha-L-fucosidase
MLMTGQVTNTRSPIDQPDRDGRIIRGHTDSRQWRPYMANADLGSYRHAPEEAYESFRDMKFGLRIHWGVYSIIQGRASWDLRQEGTTADAALAFRNSYHQLYKTWYPEKFNANEWTDMMVRSGFKFFVFTAKHHDGFSMYDTKTLIRNRFAYTGGQAGNIEPCSLHYSIMETPFARDVTAELVASAREKGLKIGLYFSHPDWYDADFRFDRWNPNYDSLYSPANNTLAWDRCMARHSEQITELLTAYGKVDMLSLDMWFPEFAWPHMQDVAHLARRLQPSCMLRWRGIGNYGDYHTPENQVPGEENQGTMAWQVIHTLSTRDRFAYEPDPAYIRGGDWIVSTLIDVVSKGGNLMIGVGPDSDGAWHPDVLASLEYAGDWLKVNGEAIYATRPCRAHRTGNVFFTRNRNHNILYAISEGWPGHRLQLKNVKASEGSVIWLLGYREPLPWISTGKDIIIILPKELQEAENRPCKQAFVFKLYGRQIDDD